MLTTSDRLDILEVVARADSAATRRDASAYVSFFTDDAVLDGEKGEYRGKELLRQSVVPIWMAEGPMSTHVTLNTVVSGVEHHPDRAIATSQLKILRNESPVSIQNLSFITQHLVKVSSHWLIERRSVRSVPEQTGQGIMRGDPRTSEH
jgi:ketosteroid isomerase-like protein